ncbi:MAG TPA: RNA-binding S4 domain-containing protein [Clostridiales bacterium]|nr:RNA-binding S4 domain-containing protein [Clostridiales bacterium]
MKIKVKIKEKERQSIGIDTPFIKLDAFLKFCGAAESGGHAKSMVNDGMVRLNGEVCLQRGKKVRPGDEVEVLNVIYKIENDGT